MTPKILKLIGLSILLGIIAWVMFAIMNPRFHHKEGTADITSLRG